jgi:DNA helicase-2/ATP-dependent DNA helicase PcrA
MVSYVRCPRQCYWSVIEPRRQQASAAALVGSEMHKWIERVVRRQPVLFDVEPTTAESAVLERLQRAFLASPYADLEPLLVETPFSLRVGDRAVRGRIDAVYERDGRIELVDFKTGRPFVSGDPAADVQLNVYALAAVDILGYDADRLRATYCYLDPGSSDAVDVAPVALLSRDLDAAMIDGMRDEIERHVAAFGSGAFGIRPGRWCTRCDFAGFCPGATQ